MLVIIAKMKMPDNSNSDAHTIALAQAYERGIRDGYLKALEAMPNIGEVLERFTSAMVAAEKRGEVVRLSDEEEIELFGE